MKPIFFVLLGLAVPLRLAAVDLPALKLPPWFGDNAVILPAEPTRLFETKSLVFHGESSDPRRVKVLLSAWPTDKLSAEADGEPDPRGGLAPWRISTRELSQRLPSGLSFNLTVSLPPRGKNPGTLLSTTNLAVGQVWVLGVEPTRDSHELPKLSEAARQRVRVLSLEGDSWNRATGAWLTAEEAERRKLVSFCGLPRAFANALATQGAPIIGLILRPMSSLGLDAVQKSDLDRSKRVLAPTGSPQFAAGLEAAFDANGAPGFGALDRFARSREDHISALTELKREGDPGGSFPGAPWRWQHYLPGESAPLPLRVTGVIW